jgi:hypothetical protein
MFLLYELDSADNDTALIRLANLTLDLSSTGQTQRLTVTIRSPSSMTLVKEAIYLMCICITHVFAFLFVVMLRRN